MSDTDNHIDTLVNREYSAGFVTDIEEEKLPPGLDENVVRFISAKKGEPEWLTDWRLEAYRHWRAMTPPTWAHVDFAPIDFEAISYYAAPKSDADGPATLDEVDPELLRTYEKLGIPLHEQAMLAGVAVDAVFDSVSITTTFKDKLAEAGVIFCSISEAVREHPELVRKYLASVVPVRDNFYAALNSAVLSDGSFVYVPKGVRCPMELSTYFRINAQNTGQSNTRPSRTGTPVTPTVKAASTTSSPNVARAWANARRSPGPRWKRAPPSPGSTPASSCAVTTVLASSIPWL
jgi:Fe-S cluster assembly protein SufB